MPLGEVLVLMIACNALILLSKLLSLRLAALQELL